MATFTQIEKAKELARELYIHSSRVTTQTCWEDALRFVLTLDELAFEYYCESGHGEVEAENAGCGK